MGTYTTNKNLFLPSVGETGWGELVNGNFTTIDTYLKPISLSGSTYTFMGNHVGNQSGGSIGATSITNSGTLTQTGTSTFTGKITANGGIGTKALTTTSISNSGNITNTGTLTSTGKIYANGGINVAGKIIGVNSYTVSYGNDNINPYLSVSDMYFYVLPYALNTTYSGSLQIRNIATGTSTISPYYWIVTDNSTTRYDASSITKAAPHTITFTNIRALFVNGNQTPYADYFRISKPILS